VGSPFDPNLHDGIMREANNEVPDGTVLEEFRKGFMIGDKLLRPAMVKVSFTEDAAPAAAEGEAAGEAASGSE
jgi:molecular chaperone GrpE